MYHYIYGVFDDCSLVNRTYFGLKSIRSSVYLHHDLQAVVIREDDEKYILRKPAKSASSACHFLFLIIPINH